MMNKLRKNNNISFHDKLDKRISIALMSTFVILTIQYFILIVFNFMDTNAGTLIQNFSKVFVGLVYLSVLPLVLKSDLMKIIKTYFLVIFVILLHYAFYIENRIYIERILFPIMFMNLPAFVYSLCIKDFKKLKEIMTKASYIVFLTCLVLWLFIISGQVNIGLYSMALSYYILLPTIIFLDKLMDRFSFFNFGLSLLSLLMILTLGSRGAILCIIVFVLLKFIKKEGKRTYRSVLIYLSLVCSGLVFIIYRDKVIMTIYNLLFQLGLSSRTLLLFLQDGVHLSGRDEIYTNVIQEILKSPVFGIGLAGDRRFLDGSYVHNFFIEILGNFGLIIGSLLSILLILIVAKAICNSDKSKSEKYRVLL